MNNQPQLLTPTTPYPTIFQKFIRQKSEYFVGRRFVFTAIHEFLHHNNNGYFTLIGSPGSGKSAILAHYVTKNPQTVYYSAEVEGKNRADQFLIHVCSQLAQKLENPETTLPDNITEGNLFLSVLLQKISDSLSKDERLIITIDGCDRLDPNSSGGDKPPKSHTHRRLGQLSFVPKIGVELVTAAPLTLHLRRSLQLW